MFSKQLPIPRSEMAVQHDRNGRDGCEFNETALLSKEGEFISMNNITVRETVGVQIIMIQVFVV